MRVLKLTLAYDGTNYAGWQAQPDQPTVQETLEAAFQKVTGESWRAVASGRTDAGVHALAQVVSIGTESPLGANILCRALNANLPDDIAVRRIVDAPADFHAIRDAVRKRYRYVLRDDGVRDVFSRHYCWQCPYRLNETVMRQAVKSLVGNHDFASFQSSGSERASTVRTVYELNITRPVEDAGKLIIEIEADGFLYNMVRAIVGVLVKIGRNAERPEWAAKVLKACDRRAGGPTAPPQGLFLVRVDYGD